MRRFRRGLTLLETLLATIILAMLASVCAPMMSNALRVVGDSDAAFDRELQFDLSRLADQFMVDSARFGCKDLPKAIQQSPVTIVWPADFASAGAHGDVTVSSLPKASEGADHLWLKFTCKGETVARYLVLPKEPTKS